MKFNYWLHSFWAHVLTLTDKKLEDKRLMSRVPTSCGFIGFLIQVWAGKDLKHTYRDIHSFSTIKNCSLLLDTEWPRWWVFPTFYFFKVLQIRQWVTLGGLYNGTERGWDGRGEEGSWEKKPQMWKWLGLQGFSKQSSRFHYTYLDNWGHGKTPPCVRTRARAHTYVHTFSSRVGQRNNKNNVN